MALPVYNTLPKSAKGDLRTFLDAVEEGMRRPSVMRDAETIRRSRASLRKTGEEESDNEVAQMGEMQRANRKMANESNKSMGEKAPAKRDTEGSTKPFQMEETKEELGLTPVTLSRVEERQRQKAELDAIQDENFPNTRRSNTQPPKEAAAESAPAAESKPVKMVNPLDKVQESLKGPNTIFGQPNTKFASYDSLSDMANDPVSESMKAPDRDFEALFKKATGTSFNAKSKGDRAAMAELQDLMSKRADLADKSDTKVALAWYASKKK
jgi:hypothetical protein